MTKTIKVSNIRNNRGNLYDKYGTCISYNINLDSLEDIHTPPGKELNAVPIGELVALKIGGFSIEDIIQLRSEGLL